MKVLFIDLYNMVYRAHYGGFSQGPYGTIYTFMRSFRAAIEQFKPDYTIVVSEGNPSFRHNLYPEYKAQRALQKEKQGSLEDFKRQRASILDILSYLPIKLIKHNDYECDDVIASLINKIYYQDECIILSGDRDYLQINKPNISVYNPIKKEFYLPNPNALKIKALLGDSSDNITGIPRVGEKTVQRLINLTSEELDAWLDEEPIRRQIYQRNMALITFAEVPIEQITTLSQASNFDKVKQIFEQMNFQSLIADKYWNRFVETF